MTTKVKVQFEYIMNCSPKVLYNRLSSASGLAEWFADDVRVKGKQYTFIWDGAEQVAEKSLSRENQLVRFNWIDEDEMYIEFKIIRQELTGDVSLLITDFTEEGEEKETEDLWTTQITDLKHVLGS